jgi:Rieske 2Fe-2S family protein
VRELLGESVIVTRGGDGGVGAFFNVCRHRGSRVCAEGGGNAARFVCPYHQWTYRADDGRLLAAPGLAEGDGVDYAAWGLHRAQVDVWHGLVFVGLGEEPLDPLSPALDACASDLLTVDLESVKLAHEERYDIHANWKLVLENSVECYHCAANHPELCATMDRRAMYAALEDATASQTTANGGRHDRFLFAVGGFPLKPGMKTLSPDGEFVCTKLLGEPGFGAGFSLVPVNTHVYFHADYGRVMHATPVSKLLTRWVTQWFVAADAVEGVDYDRERVVSVMDATTRQDVALTESVQRGVASRRYVPGPISIEREPGMRAALGSYFALMGEEPEPAVYA